VPYVDKVKSVKNTGVSETIPSEICCKNSQAHGAWISFPPPPFSLLPHPLFSKFSYKSFLFQKLGIEVGFSNA
jgi:hypothetical protein